MLLLPKRGLTRLAGRIFRSPLSKPLIPVFIQLYGIDAAEAASPLHAYRSLAEFFARRVKRKGIAHANTEYFTPIYSPVDGQIAEVGQIHANHAIQAKGSSYSISALLASATSYFESGTFVTIYLSPADYHRVHIPIAAHVKRIVHVPGTLFPVNRLGTQYVDALFTRNERIVTWFEREECEFAMVKIGSTIVGSVQIDPSFGIVKAKQRQRGNPSLLWEGDRVLEAFDEYAWFEFGSTVILLFPPNCVSLEVKKGERVKAFDVIGRWQSSDRDNVVPLQRDGS